jgi:tetratricopeptide (TPR) repeat protein
MNRRHPFVLRLVAIAAATAVVLTLSAVPVRAGSLVIPPDAQQALNTIYSGDPQQAILLARAFQQAHPQDPLGYLIEAEARWWERYCQACDVKWGMVEAWKHDKQHDDESYFALADKAIELAGARLGASDTAPTHFYAGMGYALKVRVYGVRGENRNAAKAAVRARSEMLSALALDPQMADATAAMGIYNYYVDTLSPVVKLLRFFMGIPGGDKEKGVEQMQVGMNQGTLLAVDVRFILARALRQYDRKYDEALMIAQPLVERYPQNPLFLLLLGNLNAELGRNAKAAGYFDAVRQLPDTSSPCLAHARELAEAFSSSLH